ncbi:hypothetical protein FSY45_12520 [Comamonas sp. Z1]|nr:hypothetical protein FSY45_12520 [Comamonas sp. Z1]
MKRPASRHAKTACTGSTPKPANAYKSKHPLSGFAASPSLARAPEGDDTLGAGRPFLGVSCLNAACSRRSAKLAEKC